MALPTVSSLPVNLASPERKQLKELTINSVVGSKFKAPPPDEENSLVQKSLKLTSDERFQAIKYYKDNAHTNDHLNRLMDNKASETVAAAENADELTFEDIANRETNEKKKTGQGGAKRAQNNLAERMDWQEAFDKSVNRLLIDFDLTHAPEPRLNHLDRMYNWFEDHGGKQQRKARKAPSYIIADRNEKMPAGSTKNVPNKLSGTSQLLAGAFLMRGNPSKSPRSPGSPRGPMSAR